MSALFFWRPQTAEAHTDRLLRMVVERERRLSASSYATYRDVALFAQRISHMRKLRTAKKWLVVHGIRPWTKWDYSNKAFRWKRS